jgi:predicted methyltransferase
MRKRSKKMRATINSNTFYDIFKDKDDILEMMVTSLSNINIKKVKNNITCNINNPKKLDYVIWMPEDNVLKIKNIKNNEILTINLNKKKM